MSNLGTYLKTDLWHGPIILEHLSPYALMRLIKSAYSKGLRILQLKRNAIRFKKKKEKKKLEKLIKPKQNS